MEQQIAELLRCQEKQLQQLQDLTERIERLERRVQMIDTRASAAATAVEGPLAASMIGALYGDSQTWHKVERLQAQLQLLQQQVQQQQPRYWQVQSWDASASDWWAWPGARWQQQASASDWQQQGRARTTRKAFSARRPTRSGELGDPS